MTDPKIAANVLKWAVAEMEKRIRKLASEGVRNIEQYNNIIRGERTAEQAAEDLKPLHYIVIIIDELADLMMVSSHEVEESITRAGPDGARGRHPPHPGHPAAVRGRADRADQGQLPARISFRVAARVDSRTILDSIGAEHLLAKATCCSCPRAPRASCASTAPS